MKWRIYYGDGSTFSDRDGPPERAPVVDVQCVVHEANNARGFVVRHNKDAWIWMADHWRPVDWPGLYDHLYFAPNPKTIIFGRTVRDDDFWHIVGRATREGLG